MSQEMQTGWVDALAAEQLPTEDVVAVVVAGREVALYATGGAVYATDNHCTHGDGRLCEGFLEGFEIECPLHQGRFDIRDGRPLCDPVAEPVRSYPVRIEGARVLVRIDA